MRLFASSPRASTASLRPQAAALCAQAATQCLQAATLCVQVRVLSGHRGPLLCAALSTPLDLVLSGAARAPSCAGGGGLGGGAGGGGGGGGGGGEGGGEGGGGSSCIVWSAAKGRFVRLLSVESTPHAVCVSHTGSGLLVFTVCFHLPCLLYLRPTLPTLLTLLTLLTTYSTYSLYLLYIRYRRTTLVTAASCTSSRSTAVRCAARVSRRRS